MLNLDVLVTNPRWDRHLIISGDIEINNVKLIFSQAVEEKQVTCYGISQLNQPSFYLFAATIFGDSKSLENIISLIQKAIESENSKQIKNHQKHNR